MAGTPGEAKTLNIGQKNHFLLKIQILQQEEQNDDTTTHNST
jgi:hypothetical protein